MGRRLAAFLLASLVGSSAALSEPLPLGTADESSVQAGPHGAVLEVDPSAMVGLEARGLSLARLFGVRGADTSNAALAETPLFASLIRALRQDLEELDARPTIGGLAAPNHPFRLGWLSDRHARFELAGAVQRFDRAFALPPCGEARLVYRLVLQNEGRPPTPLPMTVNVAFALPAREGSCASTAAQALALPARGAARVDALAARFAALSGFVKVETNLQNLHGPALRPGEDDHAEYLLHTFVRRGDALVPEPLLATPRADLDRGERAALAAWIREHFEEIDAGTAVIPREFLATRAISVAPRGLARARNRVFSRLFGDGAEVFSGLPYARAKVARSPRGLVRRLDQGTCSGCHESRAIAGFHLLGEARDPAARFNALSVGESPQLLSELGWRLDAARAMAEGRVLDRPRPAADRGASGGGPGARCAKDDDPSFVGLTCDPGLRCRDLTGDELGTCVPVDGNHEGDPCEDARAVLDDGPDGDRIVAATKEGCSIDGASLGPDACSPNHYGFPGGVCTADCATPGRAANGSVCVDLPASGYESDCFPLAEPIERCLASHLARRRVRGCDAAHPCREDFACARVPGLGPAEGACVPPYFVFQARVDGPLLDR